MDIILQGGRMFIKSLKIKGVRINIFEHEYLRKLSTLPPVFKNDSKPKGVNTNIWLFGTVS